VPVLQGRLDYPRIFLRPIVSAPRDKLDTITVSLNTETEAIVLDFVKPLRAGRNLIADGREAELKRLKKALGTL
jgi:hypothetical protein